ncbi:MAG: formate dehydrogenase subunit alpha [Dehalococcoidia bacterium]
MSITLTINTKQVEVSQGSTVLEAINQSEIYIPQLCKDPDMDPIGACRTCLVQIEGTRGFPASCYTPVREGMAVHTDTPEVTRIRRGVLELTLAMLPSEVPGEGLADHKELKVAAERHGVTTPRFQPRHRDHRDESNPFFIVDMADCILCGRCVDACQKVQQIGAIAILGHAQDALIGAFMDVPIAESICTSCGQCVASCPTGAIMPKLKVEKVVKQTSTICPYCGVGCGIILETNGDGKILAVQDEPSNKSSQGKLCVKGRFGTSFVDHPDRLTTPLVRKEGALVPTSWEEALETVVEGLVKYRGSVVALASAKATNEDGYVMQKLMRLAMGTNSIDHCTRLCHSPSVEAMLTSLGSGATSNSYVDYENAGCLMIVGADPSSNHPVVATRFRKAVDEYGARLIVVNPRRIELCDYAHLWLRERPGTDVALFNAIAKVIMDEGLWDEEFVRNRTEGFDKWLKSLAPYTPEHAESVTGVPAKDIIEAAHIFARPPHGGSCLIWGMGVTQHTNGTANAHALLNLALVTGQMGKPGCGISPLRGQNNVQGCGDAGCVPDSLPGYQGLGEAVRAKFADIWGGEPPGQKGLVVTEMMEEAGAGRLKAMYIVGENPLLSEPDLKHAKETLEKLEFLVVQDIFLHETAEIAHVVLPATSFAEKDGTFTNSERRVQRVRKAIEPIGQSRADWEIICDVARRVCRRLGLDEGQFSYNHPSEIFQEMAWLTPIIAGISYQRLDKEGGIQWPCPTPDHPGTPYLYAESFTRGLGKFIPVEQGKPAAELPSKRFPLILNTGRILYHWHGGTMTRRVAGLLARAPELQVAINPIDAEAEGIGDGEWIRVLSRRGELEGKAMITEAMKPGEIFVPFVKLAKSAANFLTNTAYDPTSKIPEYKVCAVRIEKRDAPSPRRMRKKPHQAPTLMRP